MPMLPEIHLVQCKDLAECTNRATALARWMDKEGDLVNQRELCERHAKYLKDWATGVRDLRHSKD